MSLVLDSNCSRRLGVGERIVAGVFARPWSSDLDWAMVGPDDHICGSYVTDDSDLNTASTCWSKERKTLQRKKTRPR
jgi:hypothetical protein